MLVRSGSPGCGRRCQQAPRDPTFEREIEGRDDEQGEQGGRNETAGDHRREAALHVAADAGC